MFGRPAQSGNVFPPLWARQLIARYCPDVALHWHAPATTTRGRVVNGPTDTRRHYGSCWPFGRRIEVWGHADESDSARMVVLHEIAHTLSPPLKTGKQRWHSPKFWRTACMLYRRHGLMEYAAKHEGYARGRKYIARRLEVVCGVQG